MKVSRIVGPALACVLLAGCFEADQDLIVKEDGSATFRTKMAMDASLLQMSEDDDFCAPEENVSVSDVAVEQDRFTEDDMEVCVITASGPIDRLAEWIEKTDHTPAGADDEVPSDTSIRLKRDGSDYVFSVHIETQAQDAGDEEMMQEAKAMIAAAIGDRSLSWSVSAPKILKTNGELSEDGKKSSFSVPLADLLDGSGHEHSFETKFSVGSPGLIKRLLGG